MGIFSVFQFQPSTVIFIISFFDIYFFFRSSPFISFQKRSQNYYFNQAFSDFFPFYLGVKLTIICPCTEKHIQKYSSQAIRIVLETPDLYKTVTEPRIQKDCEVFALDVRRY